MENKIKVRFNLGAGKHYMKWKVEGPSGTRYHDPNEVQLVLAKCKLKNRRRTAQKIFDGVNKTVCAWIICDSISINYLDHSDHRIAPNPDQQLKYNPRVSPNWILNDKDVDNMNTDHVYSVNNKLYIL
jgi:hypothetical protein